MLKLDTQGYDRQVFHGSHSCLDKFCVLQSELSFISVYEGMPDAYEVLEEYHKQGFFISGIYPINRDACASTDRKRLCPCKENHSMTDALL